VKLDFTVLDQIKSNSVKDDFREENKEFIRMQEDKEKEKEVYRIHQENRRKSEVLQSEILKGLKNGEEINIIFLKALETIGLLIGSDIFYKQAIKYINDK